MKKCTHCKKAKRPSGFSPSKGAKDGLASWCKKCKADQGRARNREYMREYGPERRKRVREWVDSFKARGCERCPETDLDVLDLHHRDPKEKLFEFASTKLLSFERLAAEAAKCSVLCANCHRRAHSRRIRAICGRPVDGRKSEGQPRTPHSSMKLSVTIGKTKYELEETSAEHFLKVTKSGPGEQTFFIPRSLVVDYVAKKGSPRLADMVAKELG